MIQSRIVSKTKVFDKLMVRVYTKVLWLDSPSAKSWGLMLKFRLTTMAIFIFKFRYRGIGG